MDKDLRLLSLNPYDGASLARMALKLLDLWDLTQEERELLVKSTMGSLSIMNWQQRLGVYIQNREELESLGHLLSIHRRLRFLFPCNRELAYSWMTRPNKVFDGLKPIEVIQQDGFPGLLDVCCYLDRAVGAAID